MSTAKVEEQKFKSQAVPQAISFEKNKKTFCFKVFEDVEVGIGNGKKGLPSLSMEVDEDCETTSSMRNYGENLCLVDLKQSLFQTKRRIQSQSSYSTYEDM